MSSIINPGKIDPNQSPVLQVLRADLNQLNANLDQLKGDLDTLSEAVEKAFKMFAAGNLAVFTEIRDRVGELEKQLTLQPLDISEEE